MNTRSELGAEGENKACEYLVEKGFKIFGRNVREVWGELDIIAIASDKTLVFVEVKTMKDGGEDGLRPEDQMSKSKLKKFRKTASLYAGAHEDLITDSKGWRLDLVTLTEKSDRFLINHYENV